MAQDFGKNVELNKLLAAATGYTGDFGGPNGKYRQFLKQADPETRAISDAILRNQADPRFATYQFSQQYPSETVTPMPEVEITTTPQDVDFSPVTTQLTPIQTGVTGLAGDVGTLQSDVTGLTTDVGTVQEGVTGLGTAIGQPVGEQTDLFAGQRGLMSEVGDVGTQVEGVGTQVEGVGTQVAGVGTQVGGVQTGVTDLKEAVGTPAEGDPRTLFAGQAGLMAGQTQLGEQIGGGVDRLTGEITNVGADLTALQRASDAYQREAQRQRTLAAQAGQTGREQLERQVAGVGQQANRLAEAQAAQRLAATPRGMMQMGTGVAPTAGPQIAAQTAQAAQQGFRPPAQGVPAPVSPLGPQAQDPRDLVTQLQKLQAQQAGLMAQLGI
jgi:hypothetical protein